MASKAVVDAVMARLGATADEAGTWNGVAVVPPNRTEEPPADGSDFILVQFPVSDTSRPSVTNRFYREEGGFRILLHTQRGAGTSAMLTKTDALAALFRDQSFGGVVTQVPDAPFIDDESGNYAIASLVVPYTYNFTG